MTRLDRIKNGFVKGNVGVSVVAATPVVLCTVCRGRNGSNISNAATFALVCTIYYIIPAKIIPVNVLLNKIFRKKNYANCRIILIFSLAIDACYPDDSVTTR